MRRNRERDGERRRSEGQHAMNSESERTARELAAAWPARTFNHATDVSGIVASAVHARLRASLQSCPEVQRELVRETCAHFPAENQAIPFVVPNQQRA